MEKQEEEIPIIWKKPHNSTHLLYISDLSLLLDHFIKRYRERLKIQSIMIDLETPKNSAGILNKTFIIKLHIKLEDGKILIAESEERSINEAMQHITSEIDNQSRSTDREKHHDSSRKHG
ncbi:MAG: hypothetical protein Q7S61_06195 [bacterium]|nr:hypothetical protein [bacterium]